MWDNRIYHSESITFKSIEMKTKVWLFAIMFAFAGLVACGEKTEASDGGVESTEVSKEDTPTEEANESMDASKEMNAEEGPEYTSKYICPMHCEGSGSDEPGECPVCGMAYVENENYEAENNEDHENHDHDDHEGHDHG